MLILLDFFFICVAHGGKLHILDGKKNSFDVFVCYSFKSFNCELSVGKTMTRFYFLPWSKRMSL